jgi:hypothetical protein
MQTTTTDRTTLVHALQLATLESAFNDLSRIELDALRRAIRAARDVNPLDVTLVEIAIVAELAADEPHEPDA